MLLGINVFSSQLTSCSLRIPGIDWCRRREGAAHPALLAFWESVTQCERERESQKERDKEQRSKGAKENGEKERTAKIDKDSERERRSCRLAA